MRVLSNHRFLHPASPLQNLKTKAKELQKLFNAKDDGEKKTPLFFLQHDKEKLKVQIVKFTVKTSQSNFSGRKKTFLSNICIC